MIEALTLGQALLLVREARGMSLTEVAARAGCSVPYVHLLERDRNAPSADMLRRLAVALGVPVDVLAFAPACLRSAELLDALRSVIATQGALARLLAEGGSSDA